MNDHTAITSLHLSARAEHALMKSGITTIRQLLNYPEKEILNLPSIGKKTKEEIQNICDRLRFAPQDFPQEGGIYITKDLRRCWDTAIEDMAFSTRTKNILTHQGITTYSSLCTHSKEEFELMRGMGKDSLADLEAVWDAFRPEEADAEDDKAYELTCEICKKLDLVPDALYHALLPLLDGEEDLGLLFPYDIPEGLCNRIIAMDEVHKAVQKVLSASDGAIEILLPACFQHATLIKSLAEERLKDRSQDAITGLFHAKNETISPGPLETLTSFISSLPKEQYRYVLDQRLEGKTLKQIGTELGVTNERVRQCEMQCIRRMQSFPEDRYKDLFETYAFTEEDFCIAFDESKRTYRYLLLRYKKGTKGMDAFMGGMAPGTPFYEAATNLRYKDYVMVEGERMHKDRYTLASFVLKKAGDKGLRYPLFKEQYAIFLSSLGLKDDKRLSIEGNGFKNTLDNDRHFLGSLGLIYRYYPIDEYDWTDFFESLDLVQYKDVELSTQVLFRTHRETMEDYRIQNGYELHNLLKKLCTKEQFPTLEFQRMPMIAFGKVDRNEQILSLLLELEPISLPDFAKAYEENYGVLPQTLGANAFSFLRQYLADGILTVNQPTFPDEKIRTLKRILTKDFYTRDELNACYIEAFPEDNCESLTPFILRSLGFSTTKDLVFSKQYGSLSGYTRHLLLDRKDSINIHALPSSLTRTASFFLEVDNLRRKYDIVECAPSEFLPFSCLAEKGVTKEEIRDYTSSAFQAAKDEFFTIQSLTLDGFTHPLDALAMDSWFYAFLLGMDKAHFTSMKMGHNRIFCKGDRPCTFPSFLCWIVMREKGQHIKLEDLKTRLFDYYHLSLPQDKIMANIRKSDLLYDVDSTLISLPDTERTNTPEDGCTASSDTKEKEEDFS